MSDYFEMKMVSLKEVPVVGDVEQKDDRFILIVDGNEVSGLWISPEKNCGTITIWGFGTFTSYRNKGYGSSLLYQVCKKYLDEGKEVRLFVMKDNHKAISLYEKMGFEKVHRVYELKKTNLKNVLTCNKVIKASYEETGPLVFEGYCKGRSSESIMNDHLRDMTFYGEDYYYLLNKKGHVVGTCRVESRGTKTIGFLDWWFLNKRNRKKEKEFVSQVARMIVESGKRCIYKKRCYFDFREPFLESVGFVGTKY